MLNALLYEKDILNCKKIINFITSKVKHEIKICCISTNLFEINNLIKDLVESIKTYRLEYPKKKNFPRSVYKAAYNLVEYATNQFEENTKKIEELIRKREKNIKLASVLRDATAAVKARAKNWKEIVKKLQTKYPADVAEALNIIGGTKDKESDEYKGACKLIDAKINNLEANLHIEIDMERIEDKSKALSYIGIEIAEALKYIPAPVEEFVPEETVQEVKAKAKEEAVQKAEVKEPAKVNPILATEPATKKEVKADKAEKVEKVETNKKEAVSPVENKVGQTVALKPDVKIAKEEPVLDTQYVEQTRFYVKPSLWQRFKNSKIIRTISYIMKIKVVLEFPALPEGRGEGI